MASTNPSAALEVTPPLGHRCLNYRNMMTLKRHERTCLWAALNITMHGITQNMCLYINMYVLGWYK